MMLDLPPGTPGARSAVSARCLAKDERRRLCEVVVSTGAATWQHGHLGRPAMNAAAGDLTLVEAGNVPLLIAHDPTLEALVGIVEAAWFDGGELRAILRYGTSVKAEAVWRQVCDDLPVRASMGLKILEIEPPEEEGDPILYTSWRLDEVSLALFGKDAGARVRVEETPASRDEWARMVSEKRDLALVQRFDAFLDQFGAAHWRGWSGAAADELADEFGVSAEKLRSALARRVESQLQDMAARRCK
jgi:hypothetical protein